ncbi:hypothetical protein DBV15_04176 [Temnothorax longispinosus]|uniref:Uncharacterized protein n=1 Tax=Temnothorax longispinosus TaxID=300112 RepID=A0A4S2KEJ0_9HYME|nr:hypothetical protein DBV15_04176 [Temnothorax longispinosus]
MKSAKEESGRASGGEAGVGPQSRSLTPSTSSQSEDERSGTATRGGALVRDNNGDVYATAPHTSEGPGSDRREGDREA